MIILPTKLIEQSTRISEGVKKCKNFIDAVRQTISFKIRSIIITVYLYVLLVIQICLIIESDH